MKLRKKQRAILMLIISLLLMAAIIPFGIWVTHTPSAELGNGRLRCESGTGTHASHTMVIQNGALVPARITAHKCDTLTITNLDSRKRLIVFGPRANPAAYDGISEQLLTHNQSVSVTLIRTGTFTFYDHLDPAVQDTFTVI